MPVRKATNAADYKQRCTNHLKEKSLFSFLAVVQCPLRSPQPDDDLHTRDRGQQRSVIARACTQAAPAVLTLAPTLVEQYQIAMLRWRVSRILNANTVLVRFSCSSYALTIATIAHRDNVKTCTDDTWHRTAAEARAGIIMATDVQHLSIPARSAAEHLASP
jgi:hypothetical protein